MNHTQWINPPVRLPTSRPCLEPYSPVRDPMPWVPAIFSLCSYQGGSGPLFRNTRSVGQSPSRLLKKKSISIFFGTSEGHFRHHLCKFNIFTAKEIL